MLNIFSQDKINTGRQPELDLLKAVSIFFVILAHVSELVFSDMWEDLAYCNFTFGWQLLWIWMSCVIAFAFMFSMGASMTFGKDHEPGNYYKRGKKLLVSWIVLRLCYLYPVATMYAEKVGTSKWAFGIATLLNSDILCFAGLFFIFVGLMRQLKINIWGILAVALGIFFVGHFVTFNSEIRILNVIMGNFLITEATSFPFINWIMAPTLGLCWGTLLQHCSNKDRLYSWTGAAGLLGLVIAALMVYSKGMLNGSNIAQYTDVKFFYHANVYTVALACCCLGVFLSVCYGIVLRLQQEWFVECYKFLSKGLTDIYFAQWVIIPWLTLLIPHPTVKMSMWWATILSCIVLAISVAAVKVYTKLNTQE